MRPPYRRKTAVPRSTTYPYLTRMKLRSSHDEKRCVCQKEIGKAKSLKLLEMKNSGVFTDKILMSSDCHKITVHRIVMASLSISFRKMMETYNVTLLSYPKEVIQMLVMLAYTGACDLDEKYVEKTLEAAREYGIEALVKICGEFLVNALTKKNALSFYRLSVNHCCEHVINSVSKFLCHNFKSLVTSGEDALLSITAEEILLFVQNVELQMTEEELHQFIIKEWMKTDTIITKFQLDEIMNWIPLQRRPAKVVFATGGWSSSPTDVMETFNPLSSTWAISSTKLPINSAYHGAAELEGNLYIAGGYDGNQYLDSLHCLNMTNMTWMEMSPMLSKRCYIATATLDGKLYVLGGHDGASRLQTVEMYDPKTNMWKEMPSMNHRRSDFGVTVLEGKIFAVGGFDGQDVLSSVEYFCPTEGKWIDSSPLTTPRSGLRVVMMEDKIFVLGGYDGTERLSSVECFKPGMTRTSLYQVPEMLH